MKILLTGVTGQIGSALRLPLEQLGEVIAADRKMLDLSQTNAIADALDKLRPELIVNPAAYTNVDAAEDEQQKAFAVNAEAPAALAAWAKLHDVPIIHFSTDYVYDGGGSQPWCEDDRPNPISAYGRSKLAGEQAIRASGAVHLIVRTSWIYASEGRNFFLKIANLARERDELQVVADQVGAPTSAATVAANIVAIIGSNQAFRRSGLIHIACSGYASWHGFASAIIDGMRCRGMEVRCRSIRAIASEDYPTRAIRPKNSRLCLKRSLQDFAISPPHWRVALDMELDRFASSLAEAFQEQ
jgi:dTDP-4-dehydrorhamnose reductase